MAPANPPAASAPAPKSQNVTINLINRLVERGVLSKEDADGLIKQAEADAAQAHAEASAAQAAATQAVAAQSASEPAPASDDEMRVTYVPDVVK